MTDITPAASRSLPDDILAALATHLAATMPRLQRLWNYYRNPATSSTGSISPARLAQEAGLPSRVTGNITSPTHDDRIPTRREVVVENDIAWRIHTLVDFMFGKPLTILSTAADETRRDLIQQVLERIFERSGGIGFLQDIALLGHVYGSIDIVITVNPAIQTAGATADPETLASFISLELVEPTRAISLLESTDYRNLRAFAVHIPASAPNGGPSGRDARSLLERLVNSGRSTSRTRPTGTTRLHTPGSIDTYIDGTLRESAPSLLPPGQLGIIHIQNISQPFRHEGLSEVEPLIPLQDELNTRLSDRASRLTMQNFTMYLAKGLLSQTPLEVGPGAVWFTDNPDANIQTFGGNASSEGEDLHISEIREALDKASSVPPVATGVVKAKIGNLTSANALRITLMGVLGKTARKRVTYGRGISELCRIILATLDHHGVLATDALDRGVRLEWPDPLPIDPEQTVRTALLKQDLGVPRPRLLAELGYAPTDPGVQ